MSKAGPTGGALLLLGVVCAFDSGRALAADRFTSTSGSDAANDCLINASPCRTIGHALTQAVSGDTIKLAEGSYAEASLTISGTTTLSISGGWAADFSTQNPDPKKTTVDGHNQGPIFTISAASTTADVTLDALTIAKGYGGGIVVSSSGTGSLSLSVENCVLRSSKEDPTFGVGTGGGIYASSSDTSSLSIAVTNSTFKRNVSYGGGGMWIYSSNTSSVSLSLTSSTFIGNKALDDGNSGSGGGLAAFFLGTADVTIDGCTFKSNRGGFYGKGGAIYFAGVGPTLNIVNSTFLANHVGEGGGGIWLVAGGAFTTSVVNSTVSRNRGGGVTFSGSSSASLNLKNAILWGNTFVHSGPDDLLEDTFYGNPAMSADHCDIGAVVSGSLTDLGGNINADPRLAGLHLTAGSPALDTGTCTGAPATDFEGDPRPSGGGCDIGADEFVP